MDNIYFTSFEERGDMTRTKHIADEWINVQKILISSEEKKSRQKCKIYESS